MTWICPKCRAPMQRENSWVCALGHSYDIARQGYTNLLLANKKNSREPGDSEEMIQARRQFLQTGFYEPIVSSISDYVTQNVALTRGAHIFDMGCGEGYYLRTLRAQLQAKLTHDSLHYSGIDIAKPAIKKAAGADKASAYAVASCFDIPLPQQSVAIALSIFSPLDPLETYRVLADNGLFIRVAPGPKHLWEIRQKIYAQPTEHESPAAIKQFQCLEQKTITRSVHLQDQNTIANLLMMTPYFWHGHSEAKQLLLAMDNLTITTDFILQFFGKAAEDQ